MHLHAHKPHYMHVFPQINDLYLKVNKYIRLFVALCHNSPINCAVNIKLLPVERGRLGGKRYQSPFINTDSRTACSLDTHPLEKACTDKHRTTMGLTSRS